MIYWIAAAVLGIDVSAARLEVERTLEGMSEAAVALDGAAYMSHVSSDDVEFLHEQRYFANDLKKKPPATVRWTIAERPAGESGAVEASADDGAGAGAEGGAEIRVIADGVIEAPVEVRWTLQGEDGPSKERSVAFTAKFVRSDGDGGRWLYAGEAWATHHEPGVVVMYNEGMHDLAARTAEAFRAIRAGVEEEFEHTEGSLPRRELKIKIYGKMNHLQQSISLGYVMPLGGWNEPGESIKMLANPRTAATGLRNVLAHEYGHVATFEMGPAANSIPWWLIEGAAEIAAQPHAKNLPARKRTVARWVRDEKAAPWDDISDFDRTPGKYYSFVYAQGHTMAAFVTERFGRAQRNRWLRSLAQGATLDAACRDALSTTFEELDASWREWLAAEEETGAGGS